MDDILLSRLTALSNNVAAVLANFGQEKWRSKRHKDTRVELLEEGLWWGMQSTIVRELDWKKKDLEQEIKRLRSPAQVPDVDASAGSKAWGRYNEILRDVQSLLPECLEIVGNLAIRNKDLDEKFLHVADWVIRDCLSLTTGTQDYYLTIHGLDEAFSVNHGLFETLSQKKAKIILMGFPEWTIWDLPSAAHELGRVSLETILSDEISRKQKDKYLSLFLADQKNLMSSQSTVFKPLLDEQENLLDERGHIQLVPQAEHWADSRVRKLVADALATYVMGPAYAFCAFNLRFNPFVKSRADTPSDAERAHLVISMLEWMNSLGAQPYKDVIGKLKEVWEDVMTRSKADTRLTQADKDYLESFALRFANDVCERSLFRAMYSQENWGRVQALSNHWVAQQKNIQELSIPEDLDTNPQKWKLRDVLNAIWFCRQSRSAEPTPETLDKNLARLGMELCHAYITERQLSRSRSSRSARGGKSHYRRPH
jgi:hypothetical protein